mgnify:CR=1 FL=1
MKGFGGFGNSPAKQLTDDDKKTLKAIDKEEWIGTHVSEGSEESQLLILKKKCVESGGMWNSKTNSCSKRGGTKAPPAPGTKVKKGTQKRVD